MDEIKMNEDFYKEIKDIVDVIEDDAQNKPSNPLDFYDNRYLYRNHQIISEAFSEGERVELTVISAKITSNETIGYCLDKFDNALFYSESFDALEDFYVKLYSGNLRPSSFAEDFEVSDYGFDPSTKTLTMEGVFLDISDWNLQFLIATINGRIYPFKVYYRSKDDEDIKSPSGLIKFKQRFLTID